MVGHVLVTGARGFIGSALLPRLLERGYHVSALTRDANLAAKGLTNPALQWINCAADFTDLDERWPAQVNQVIHLAARVHQMEDARHASANAYQTSNLDATLKLAKIARQQGVTRFVFVSSIKALGETEPGRALKETDRPKPLDPYGISKQQAEDGLRTLQGDAFAVVIARFPLVYGPGVRANFLQLARAVQRGIPLPLGRAYARRSLLAVDNATDALMTCLEHDHAVNQTFHVADRETPSVRELVERLAHAYGRKPRLINVPVALLRTVASLVGRGETIERLVDPLRVDIDHIEKTLSWSPPVTLEEGLRRFVQGTAPS